MAKNNQSGAAASSPRNIQPIMVAIAAVAVTALTLRPGATAIGPVLEELQIDLAVDSAQLGILTALPGFAFAIIGFLANKLTPRLGMIGALIFASSLTILGSLTRVLVGNWWAFLVLTFVALAGMAIGNVIVPAFIKAAFPRSSTAMSATYTTFLAIGTTLPTAFAVPMLAMGGSLLPQERAWRFSVGFWLSISIVALILWVILLKRSSSTQRNVQVGSRPIRTSMLFKSPTAVALAVFFGAQSMQAYIQFGWAAQMYRDGGLNATEAGLMIAVISLGGIPGGLIMPRIVARGKWLKQAIVAFGVLLVLGYLGIAFLPTTTPWLWAICLSISGFAFPTALAMIISRTRDPQVTSAVSGFAQPVGYLMAAAGPLLIGAAFSAIGDWKPILLVTASTSIILVTSGLIAARDKKIDDEIYDVKQGS